MRSWQSEQAIRLANRRPIASGWQWRRGRWSTGRPPAGVRPAGACACRTGLETAGSPLVKRDEDVLYLPIATAERVVGVLEVGGKPGGGRFGAEDEQLLTTFADQAALALERARMSEEAAQAAVLAQSDELKSALLAAVSHDLRTPLASIKASATSLLDDSVDLGCRDAARFLDRDRRRDRPPHADGRQPARSLPDRRRRVAAAEGVVRRRTN